MYLHLHSTTDMKYIKFIVYDMFNLFLLFILSLKDTFLMHFQGKWQETKCSVVLCKNVFNHLSEANVMLPVWVSQIKLHPRLFSTFPLCFAGWCFPLELQWDNHKCYSVSVNHLSYITQTANTTHGQNWFLMFISTCAISWFQISAVTYIQQQKLV